MTATATETTPTTPAVAAPVVEVLGAIKDAPESFPDSSKLADREQAASLFSDFGKEMGKWWNGQKMAAGATRRACEFSLSLRQLILRADGTPDLAGTTDAYRYVYADRITSVYTKAGMSKKDYDRFQAAVRRFNADNNLNQVATALYVVEHRAGFEKYADDVVVGKPIPEPVAAEMRKVAQTQTVTNADGKVVPANGWEPNTFAAAGEVLGLKKAAAGKVERNASDNSPGASWSQIRKEIQKQTDDGKPHVSPVLLASELHHVTTELVRVLLGEGDGKLPTFAGRAKMIAQLAETAELITAAIGVTDGKVERSDAEKLYWTATA